MKKPQRGFALLEIILVVGLLVVLALVGVSAYHQSATRKNPNATPTPAQQVLTAHEGTQELTLVPGQTIVNLPSGAQLRFNGGSGPAAVPDFVFGQHSLLDGKPNYLPIKKLVKTYHNGYAYTASLAAPCPTHSQTYGDVVDTAVTSCTISLTVQKASAPTVPRTTFTKQFSVTEKGSTGRSVLSPEPYLFAGAMPNRLTRTIDGTKVYLEGGNEKIEVITNFGIGSVEYTADELYAKRTKSIALGAAKVDISVASLTCTPAYGPEAGCHGSLGDKGAIYDKFNFTAHYTPTGTGEVKIIDYQE